MGIKAQLQLHSWPGSEAEESPKIQKELELTLVPNLLYLRISRKVFGTGDGIGHELHPYCKKTEPDLGVCCLHSWCWPRGIYQSKPARHPVCLIEDGNDRCPTAKHHVAL